MIETERQWFDGECEETFHAHCDFCSTMEEFEDISFQGMVDCLKESGWQITKEHGEWVHKCPGCLEDEHELASW